MQERSVLLKRTDAQPCMGLGHPPPAYLNSFSWKNKYDFPLLVSLLFSPWSSQANRILKIWFVLLMLKLNLQNLQLQAPAHFYNFVVRSRLFAAMTHVHKDPHTNELST